MATLTGRTISASYTELLKTTGSGGITSSLDTVQDGDATDSALQLSSAGIKSTGTLEVAGVSTLTGSVTLGEDAVITFEGATDDAFETTLTTVDPTADRTVSLPNATDTLVGKATTDTLTNKTLTSPALDTGVSGTAVLDSDTMSGASATTLATSESIKAYVDAQADTDTTYTGGTNLTLDGTTFNVDDAFLKNDASDTTTGTITAGGFTTTGTLTLDSVGLSTVQTSAESFADNDTSVMTSAAVADKVEAYGYSTLALGTSSSTALAGDTTTISSGQASAITANTSKTTNATHTGEVTGSAALTIANDVVDEANLKVDNAPTDDYVLTAKASATGGLTWAASGSSGEANQNAWSTITVPAGTTSQAADTTTDSVAFTAAGGMTITGGADDTIEFSSADTNTNQLTTFTVSATTDTTATTISQGDDLFFAAGTGITCETTADGTVTIANTVTDTNTMGTGFTVAATTTGTGTTITQGDSLTIAAGTGITTTGTSDGVVTIASTVTDTNTMGAGFTVSATTDTTATTIVEGEDLFFAAGSGVACETTSDGTVTTTVDLDSLTLDSTVSSTGWSEGDQIAVIDSATTDDPTRKTYLPAEIGIACSDESTAITDSDQGDLATFLIPRKMMLTQIKFSFTLEDTSNDYSIDVRYTSDPSSTAPASASSLLTMQTPITFSSSSYSTEVSSGGFDDSSQTGSGTEDSFQLDADSFVVVELVTAESSGEATGLKCWLLGYYN